MDRVYEILDKNEEMPDREGAVDAPQTIQIAFDKVSFAYDAERQLQRGKQPRWILHDITLKVPGGSTVALVEHLELEKPRPLIY